MGSLGQAVSGLAAGVKGQAEDSSVRSNQEVRHETLSNVILNQEVRHETLSNVILNQEVRHETLSNVILNQGV